MANRAHRATDGQPDPVGDATTGEDACRVRDAVGPAGVLAGTSNAVIAPVRPDGHRDVAAALRHYAVHTAEALRLIGLTRD